MYDTHMKDVLRPGKIPSVVFKLSADYLYRLKIKADLNTEILSLNDLVYKCIDGEEVRLKDGFPIIILSHGLAGHTNCYSILAQEFASKGYIVICPYH